MAEKLDLYKKYSEYYSATTRPREIILPPLDYLGIEGVGEPGGELFESKLGALYSTAYTTKFRCKDDGRDFKVTKLEGFWWTCGPGDFFKAEKTTLRWKLVLLFPDFVTVDMLEAAKDEVREKDRKRKRHTPHLEEVSLERIHEGHCVQILHFGAYDDEEESIKKILDYSRESGLCIREGHHEIYMNDPRRVAPEKLKTLIRIPVEKTGGS